MRKIEEKKLGLSIRNWDQGWSCDWDQIQNQVRAGLREEGHVLGQDQQGNEGRVKSRRMSHVSVSGTDPTGQIQVPNLE